MWRDMIEDLRGIDFKLHEIGEAIGIGTSSVHDLMTGRRRPSVQVFLSLQALHDKYARQINKAKREGK